MQDIFTAVIFEQSFKLKTMKQTILVMETDDFFKTLQQRGIRKKQTNIEKLARMLQPSETIENFVALTRLEKTFKMMQANDEFMEALKQDIYDD